MPQQRVVRCSNCGTIWAPAARSRDQEDPFTSAAVCPVCKLAQPAAEIALKRALSADDLASELGALITDARASSLASAVIIQALRDELEFAAELANPGRRFCVQLIDLGPQESSMIERPVRDRRAALQTRSVN